MTDRGVALAGIFTGTLLISVAYGSAWSGGGAPPWGVGVMIVGCAIAIASAMLLGALRSSVRRTPAILAAGFLFVVITAGLGVPLLLLPAEGAAAPLVLGLPLRAAIEIYGVGLLPLVVLPVLFALEFKRRR